MNFEFEYATADHMTFDFIPEIVFWTCNKNVTNPSVSLSSAEGQAPDGMKSSQTRSAGPGPWFLGRKRT